MKKSFWLIIPILAAFFVFLGTGQEHYYPINKTIHIDENNVTSYVDTQKGFVAIWNQTLLFATPNGELIKAITPKFDGADCDLRVIFTDDESIYVNLGTYMQEYSYYDSERIEKYSFSGDYLGELIVRPCGEEYLVDSNYMTDLKVIDGTAYITDSRYYQTDLISVPAEPQNELPKPKKEDSVETKDFILWARYEPENERMVMFNRFGETYYYDLNTKETSYHPELIETNVIQPFGRSEIFISGKQKVLDVLYFAGIIILGISLFVGLILLLRTGVLKPYRKYLIFLSFFVIAVFFYTRQSLDEYDKDVKERVIASARLVDQGFSFYLLDDLEDAEYGNLEIYKSDKSREWINNINPYLKMSCANAGIEMGMYLQIYVYGDDGTPLLLVDTYDEFPIGTPYLFGDYKYDLKNPDSFLEKYIIEKSIDGTYSYINYPIYNSKDESVGFFQMGSRYDRIRNHVMMQVIESFLQLLAFIMFLYILLDVTDKYSAEIKDFFKTRKTDPVRARISLSNTYDFIVSGLMYLDSLLLIKAISSINTDSGVELAVVFAIPITAYRVGSWIGSVITSPLLGKFGEKRMGILSSVLSTLSFVGIMIAIMQKNIYLIAGCKFVEGIFLESILFSLAEGIPYEIEDEAYRNKKILESQSSTQAAIMISLMVAGVIAEYTSYTVLYLFGAIVCATLIPLSFAILSGGDTEEENVKTLQVWKAFAAPKALLYIVLVVLSVSFLYGYEEYLFPLFSENSGLSSIMLSSIGVLVNAASYFGEGITVLFKKLTPLQSMVRAFTVSGAAIILLILNQNVVFAVMVYFTISILFRVIDSQKIVTLVELAKDKDLEAKDIQENYYALEDGFKVFQGPVLGTLSAIAISMALGFLGTLSLAAPNLYNFIAKRKKAKDKS